MNVGIHIEANILSCLFCILLYYQQRRHKVFDFLGSTAFNSLLWASILIMLVDIVTWLFMGNLVPHTDTDLLIVQSFYYLLQTLLPLYFMIYCLNTTGKSLPSHALVVMYTPVLFTLVILLINARNGFAFVVQDNYVVRSSGFLLSIAAAMLYLINSLLLCLFFYVSSLKKGPDERKVAFHMLMCVFIIFIGALVCSVVNYVSPWHVFVASLIYLYIQLHGHREQRLDMLAFTDSLTGLKNHAAYSYVKQKMEQKLQNNPHAPFAVAVMDVNNLKKLNDAHGHKVGDALIICASKLMCRIFDHSPVCRIGGDEFVAILENSNYADRDKLQQRFNEEMQSTTFSVDGMEFPLSVALGICTYDPARHTSFDDVFQEADSTMYEIKVRIKTAN